MTPGAILAALRALFEVIKGVLGMVDKANDDARKTQAEAAGAAKVGAAEAAEAERVRKEDEAAKQEVAQRSDAELDASLDKWMRK